MLLGTALWRWQACVRQRVEPARRKRGVDAVRTAQPPVIRERLRVLGVGVRIQVGQGDVIGDDSPSRAHRIDRVLVHGVGVIAVLGQHRPAQPADLCTLEIAAPEQEAER